ncbi:RHS repeat-associated core domain-containing protein, partial [Bacteroides gallinaceum]|nr:RHS repeat-associated core domain-containing protein [Bacteroides gallinaceum]
MFISKNGVNYATPPSGYGTRYTGGYKGLLTGTVTARLDASGVAGYDYTAYYYDDRGRVIQTRSTNHLGGTDVEYVAYNFVGDPVKRQHVHTASGKATQTETYTYTYDHAGRLTVTKYKLNSNAEITLSSNTYDELGRLQTKSLHGSATNKQTYSYNIRDWLTGISGNKFTQHLYYNTGSGTPQYGGNISSMTWKAGNESTVRGYKFAYDGLSRLTSATYGEVTNIGSNA